MFKHYPVLMFLVVGAMQCAQADCPCHCGSLSESRNQPYFHYVPVTIVSNDPVECHFCSEDDGYVDRACNQVAYQLDSAIEAGFAVYDEIVTYSLPRRERVFKHLLWKAQDTKYAVSVRACAACLALCIADARFTNKTEMDKLYAVRGFENLPCLWKSRAKKAYQNVVSQLSRKLVR